MAKPPQGRVVQNARGGRRDGFSNQISGIGTARDPSYGNQYLVSLLSNAEAQALVRGNACAKKVVGLRPDHAFREGYKIECADEEVSKAAHDALEGLGASAAFKQALKYENTYGGGAIFPVINDGGNLSRPLREDGRMPDITHLHVFQARELVPASYYNDIMLPNYRQPRTWRLNAVGRGVTASNLLIHESRLITFPGSVVDPDQMSVNTGWGDSKLNAVAESIERFGISWAGVATLMQRIEQGVLKMKGFTEAVADDENNEVGRALLNLNRFRSLVDMMVIGDEDDYQRVGINLAGVSDILQDMMTCVSADAEIPNTLMWGTAPSGLNATGDSEIRNFYDSVRVEQTDHIGPRLRRLAQLYFRTNDSVTGGEEPEFSIGWHPLWQPTEKERAETNETQAKADKIYVELGTLTNKIVRRNRWGGAQTSIDTHLSEEEMSELDEADEAASEAQIEMMKTGVDPDQPADETVEDTETDPEDREA